jgi:AraC-like DNA-binding protein
MVMSVRSAELPFTPRPGRPLYLGIGDREAALVAERERALQHYAFRRKIGKSNGHRVMRPFESEISFYYMLAVKHLAGALQRYKRFHFMMRERFKNGYVKIRESGEHVIIDMKFAWGYHDDDGLQTSDIISVIGWFNFLKWATATDIEVSTVQLPFPVNDRHRLTLAPFCTRISDGANCFRIFFPRSYLTAPIVKSAADIDEFHTLVDLYLRYGFIKSFDYGQYVTQMVLAALGSNAPLPTLHQIAGLLNQSPSTLKRRLQAAGYCYRDIVTASRFKLACRLLREGAGSIKMIAARLGYQDHNAFCRAFKQWAGISPVRWAAGQGTEAAI